MARSRSKPAASSSAAPKAAPKAAPAPAPAPQQHHQQQQHMPPPQQPQMMQQRGPGLLGMMGSTMAGAVAGSVIGHGISHMMFDRSQPVTDPQQMQQVKQAYAEGPCQNNLSVYTKCMEANANNAQACNFAWELFTKCADDQQSANKA